MQEMKRMRRSWVCNKTHTGKQNKFVVSHHTNHSSAHYLMTSKPSQTIQRLTWTLTVTPPSLCLPPALHLSLLLMASFPSSLRSCISLVSPRQASFFHFPFLLSTGFLKNQSYVPSTPSCWSLYFCTGWSLILLLYRTLPGSLDPFPSQSLPHRVCLCLSLFSLSRSLAAVSRVWHEARVCGCDGCLWPTPPAEGLPDEQANQFSIREPDNMQSQMSENESVWGWAHWMQDVSWIGCFNIHHKHSQAQFRKTEILHRDMCQCLR